MVKKHCPILILLFCVFLVGLLNSQVWGYDEWAEKPTCIFGMPYIGRAVKIGHNGLIINILKHIYEPEGIVLKHEPLPYTRALNELKTGQIHCSLDIKDNRSGYLQGGFTLANYDLSVAYLKKTGWKDIHSLEGKQVAYLYGFDLETLLPVKIVPQIVYDMTSVFHMLSREYVPYALDDKDLLEDAMYESKLPTSEFETSFIKSFDVRPIFAPTDEGRKFCDIYDRRMKEMIASGEFSELLRKNGVTERAITQLLQSQ